MILPRTRPATSTPGSSQPRPDDTWSFSAVSYKNVQDKTKICRLGVRKSYKLGVARLQLSRLRHFVGIPAGRRTLFADDIASTGFLPLPEVECADMSGERRKVVVDVLQDLGLGFQGLHEIRSRYAPWKHSREPILCSEEASPARCRGPVMRCPEEQNAKHAPKDLVVMGQLWPGSNLCVRYSLAARELLEATWGSGIGPSDG